MSGYQNPENQFMITEKEYEEYERQKAQIATMRETVLDELIADAEKEKDTPITHPDKFAHSDSAYYWLKSKRAALEIDK